MGNQPFICEAEALPGLEPFVEGELRRRFRKQRLRLLPGGGPERVPFRYRDDPRDLLTLRTPVAVYLVRHFAIPRPRALLGHQNFHILLRQIETVRDLHPSGAFRTFRFSAAGKESSVFTRLRDEIAEHTGLEYSPEEADLLLRVRPATLRADGWEVLIRLSPRPLSARTWRVCDWPGALNATIAAAMVELTRPRSRDRFLNLMCGSGTLLIERLLRQSASRAVGCDIDQAALSCAHENVSAAGLASSARLVQMNATRLEFPDGSFDALVADLPWGQLVGSPEDNATLYPAVLAEAARVTVPGGRLVIITHAITLLEDVLRRYANRWALRQVIRVFQGGLHPRIYVLERTEG